MQYLMEYEDKKFQDVSKEGLKIKGSKDKLLKESFKDLTKWWKKSLASDNVDDVKISSRLADSPCVVVASKYGWSANMERIMQSQTLSDTGKQAYMRGKRALEINPRHPIIKELRVRVAKDPEVFILPTKNDLVYHHYIFTNYRLHSFILYSQIRKIASNCMHFFPVFLFQVFHFPYLLSDPGLLHQ